MTRPAALLEELESLLGPANCPSDPEVIASYITDWTGRFEGEALAVARPADTAEVAAVIEVARSHGAVLIPQGGNTGLVGGSVPRKRRQEARPQLVLSLARLARIEEVDRLGLRLLAGAGTTLGAAQRAAAAAGLGLGIDLSARESATLGGMAATNAGGLTVFRHGSMRDRLGGIEAVLANGSVVSELSGLAKDSVGWSPAALFAGSEGTLAIFTKVMLKLVPLPRTRLVALLAYSSPRAAVEAAAAGRTGLPSLESMELTLRPGMELVTEKFDLARPVGLDEGAAAWLTLELAGEGDLLSELEHLLSAVPPLESAVATETAARSRLFSYRERHTEAVSRRGVPHKLDVAVPTRRVEELLASLSARFAREEGCELYLWGHLAESNVHVNLLGPAPEDESLDDAVVEIVTGLGGTISAEHGVGVAKARYLGSARPAANLALMAAVKAALDPGRLLNPGVLEPT